MASKLLLPSALISVALIAILTPFLLTSNNIFHIYHDWSPYTSHLSTLSQKCTFQHPTQLLGCEDMHLLNNTIYTACLTTLKNRNKYWPEHRHSPRGISGDILFRWDLDIDTVVPLELRSFPGDDTAETRSFHGMDVNLLPDGTVSIYIINHLLNGSVIEKFLHDPETNYATHILRIPTTHPEAAVHPNAIFSLPELDDDAGVFVTNDHYYAGGWARYFEEITRRPWAWVSYYSTSTGWKKVLVNLIGANGITGDKSVEKRKIYVSEITNGIIRVFTPSSSAGELKEVQKIPIAMLGDNIGQYGDDLYIAGPARGVHIPRYMLDPATAGGPGMLVKRVNTKQLGGDFFGGGYTADPIVEELVVDGMGRLANMSTTALFRPYVVEDVGKKEGEEEEEEEEEEELEPVGKQKGDLFVSGLTFEGILKCTNVE
ncbi:hypothetical protein BDD12DRAFT_885201 [Trichophaea hybrida]|nr:hypothetical protein BDD12DRAFT_885201 [Trichophaea hybrida]